MESLLEIIFFMCALTQLVFADEWPKCLGGASIVGLDLQEWSEGSPLRCCDDEGTCHSSKPSSAFENSLPLVQQKPHHHSKSKRLKSRTVKTEPTLLASCCRSKISVMFPFVGYSAISGEQVDIIQVAAFRQPVVYNQCRESPCRFVRGNCTQVYSPQPLYIMTTMNSDSSDSLSSGTKLTAKLDFILVDAGCECRQSLWNTSRETFMGVDETAFELLGSMTGRLFSKEQLLGSTSTGNDWLDEDDEVVDDDLLLVGEKEEITSVSSSWVSPPSSPISAAVDGDHLTVEKREETTLSASSLATTDSKSMFEVMEETTPTITSEVLLASTKMGDEEDSTTTHLPLPKLPERHDMPLIIPAGHYDPVLQSIRNFFTVQQDSA